MKKFFSNVFTPIKAKVSHARDRAKLMIMGAAIAALTPIGASARTWPVPAMMQELPHWGRSHPSWSSTFRM